jgi:hypothetical protein
MEYMRQHVPCFTPRATGADVLVLLGDCSHLSYDLGLMELALKRQRALVVCALLLKLVLVRQHRVDHGSARARREWRSAAQQPVPATAGVFFFWQLVLFSELNL